MMCYLLIRALSFLLMLVACLHLVAHPVGRTGSGAGRRKHFDLLLPYFQGGQNLTATLQSGSIPPGRPPPLSEAGLPGRERDGYNLCTMPTQLLRAACKDARTLLPVSGTDAITTSSANLFGLFPTDGAY